MEGGELVSRQTVHSGAIAVHLDLVRTPAGEVVREEVVEDPRGTVVVVALHEDQVVLVTQHRHAVGEVLAELPAGTPEAGETAPEAAARELAEETGYRAAAMRRLGGCWAALPGLLRSWTEIFWAEGIEPGAARLEAGESIVTLLVSRRQVSSMVASGAIRDLNTIAALALAGLIRPLPPAPGPGDP